jgi:sugar phosphate isomerase/epimerase
MDVGISTRCFGKTPLTLDLLERLRRAEFTEIELHGALPGLNYHSRSVLKDIARWFRENELPAPSLHLPCEPNVLSNDRFERQAALDEFKRCLELADIHPLRFVVLHLGSPNQEFNPVAFEYAYAAVATIQAFSGVRVLAETLSNEIATFEHIGEFIQAAQLTNVGICYDTEHGEMDGPFDAMHLKGGDQEIRDWPAMVEGLKLASFAGPVILELADDSLDKAADCRSRFRDLMDEASDSIEEFRLRHKLPVPRSEDEE